MLTDAIAEAALFDAGGDGPSNGSGPRCSGSNLLICNAVPCAGGSALCCGAAGSPDQAVCSAVCKPGYVHYCCASTDCASMQVCKGSLQAGIAGTCE